MRTLPPVKPPPKKRRSSLRILFLLAMTTTMVATGGFGTFPKNSLTDTFQEVISENVSADFLKPFNSYMEVVSAPTIKPKPASVSAGNSALDPFGSIVDLVSTRNAAPQPVPVDGTALVNTAVAAILATQAQILVPTTPPPPSSTAVQSQTLAPLSSATVPVSATSSPPPSSTLAPLILFSTNTKAPPPPTRTPTITPTFTQTSTPTVSPAGFTLSNISLNTLTNGGAVFAFPNGTFTVNYSYTVWAQSNCPTCIVQLVSGMGSAGLVGTTSCAYNAISGISPGVSGTSSLTLTAPATAGTYDIVVQLSEQTNCANAISSYSGASGIFQKIGQVVVSQFIIAMFDGGTHTGNLGGRAGADASCVAAKPVSIGNTNVRAFISTSSTDTIANMPLLTPPINNNIPVVFQGGQLLAKDWPDLLDGSINAALTLSGVPSGNWWSGSESDAGGALNTTANCNGFTDASASAFGNFGNTATAGSGWISTATSQACSNSYTLLCVAGP